MDEARHRLSQAPLSALKWVIGAVGADVIVRAFEPEIALLASAIRTLLGL